jgi:hypothetical protein
MTIEQLMSAVVSRRRRYRELAWTMGMLFYLLGWAGFSGCSQNQARLTKSPEATAAFQEGQSNPNYTYYYTGRARAPHAIIGIDKNYQVSSKLWHVFTPSAEKLKKMAASVIHYLDEPAYGAYIAGASGERIGVWYSKLFFVYVEVDETNKTVKVLYKNPEHNKGLRSSLSVGRESRVDAV